MTTGRSTAANQAKHGAKKHGAKVRYAVVGLGHIAQGAVLPAFVHAKDNSELTALVSDNRGKLTELGKAYGVDTLYDYEDYEACLDGGTVDAVYIALPNHLHREYTVRAAEAGIHVLCEKPMAVTETECQAMVRAAEENDVKLMVAYRLHFEEANLKAMHLVQSGLLGEPCFFSSSFAMQVEEGNVRLEKEFGGGPLYDIGIYCINAARNLFRAEPTEVFAMTANSGDPRFHEVEETASVLLRFPHARLAALTCSFRECRRGGVSNRRQAGGPSRIASVYVSRGSQASNDDRRQNARREVFGPRPVWARAALLFGLCAPR